MTNSQRNKVPGKLTYEERLYKKALKDIEAGRFTTCKNSKELIKHLHAVANAHVL